jgi:DNA-binding NarL/FixJ family response regulator
VVDDHEVVRLGLVAFLKRRPGFAVVAQAGTAAEAMRATNAYLPDIVVMDVRLPDGSGIRTVREIKAAHPAIRVVVFTSCSDEEAVFGAMMAGASGYLLKHATCGDLVASLEAVGRGGLVIDPGVTERLLDRIRRVVNEPPRDEFAGLTGMEREILGLIAQGKTNEEIAAAIDYSARTVKGHVSSILARLGLQRRVQIAAYLTRRREARYL